MSGVSQTARPSASVYPLSRSVRSGIQRPIGFKASCIFLPLGRDHDNLTAGGVEFPLRLDKRIDAHSTVWTPMPAMEHDGRWAIRNQGFQMEQPAALIRQDKGGILWPGAGDLPPPFSSILSTSLSTASP